MRNFNLLFTFALSLAASTVHADFVAHHGLVMRQTPTSDPPTNTNSNTGGIVNNNPTPTGGVGEVIQGDTDEPPEDSEETPEPTPEPITTTDKDGHTITSMPPTSSGGSRTTSSRSRKISPDAPPGGVQMRTPSVYDGYQIYKIGDPVTFVWNYTSLQVTPTALNIQAFCTAGMQYFPIAMNVSADTTQAVWDTGIYQRTALSKLPMATYTLFIFDAARGPTAFPSPGVLLPFSGFNFGLYTPKAPTPLSSFECPTCDPSSASAFDIKTLRFILGMGLITALSFMWFVAGVL